MEGSMLRDFLNGRKSNKAEPSSSPAPLSVSAAKAVMPSKPKFLHRKDRKRADAAANETPDQATTNDPTGNTREEPEPQSRKEGYRAHELERTELLELMQDEQEQNHNSLALINNINTCIQEIQAEVPVEFLKWKEDTKPFSWARTYVVLRGVKTAYAALEEEKQQLTQNVATLQQKFDACLGDLQQQILTSISQTKAHDEAMSKLQKENSRLKSKTVSADKTMADEVQRWKNKLRDNEAIATVKLAEVEKKLRLEETKHLQQRQMEIQVLNSQHQQDLWTKDEAYRIADSNHKSLISTLHESYGSQLRDLQDTHEAEKTLARETLEAENRSLQQTRESLLRDMAERSFFKAMSDRDLEKRFQEIVLKVDAIARLQWDIGFASTWPFPQYWLQNTGNEKRSKQWILQNNIWVILFDNLFCTPFRALGAEGHALETQWVEKFSQDRRNEETHGLCPSPTRRSEQWRYEQLEECVDAITKPNTQHNHASRQQHEVYLQETSDQLAAELGQVAQLKAGDSQRLTELVEKSSKLWLEVGQQRCRISLVMSTSGDQAVRIRHEHIESEEFPIVLVPGVQREGTVQGERLDVKEVVMQCQGTFKIVPR